MPNTYRTDGLAATGLSAQLKIVEFARRMLDGKLSYIEGTRRIMPLSFNAHLEEDPDILSLTGIFSETNAFPIGEQRNRWDPDALEALQPKIDSAENRARANGEAPCRSIVKRFSSNH